MSEQIATGPGVPGASRRVFMGMGLAMGATAALTVLAKPERTVANERAAQPLEQLFPDRVGSWVQQGSGGVVRPAADQAKLYGIYDQVLERVYLSPTHPAIMLSVAYGSEQSVGLQVHRPEVCYPTGGFKVSTLERTETKVAGRTMPITRLYATMPNRVEPITYWMVLGDELQANLGTFRLKQIAFGLRGQILDGMLVRVSTLDDNAERGWKVQQQFIEQLYAAMPPIGLQRVFGHTPPAAAPAAG